MLSTSLKEILRTTPFHLKCLKEAEMETVRDLLQYYPRTYEDRSEFRTLATASVAEINTIRGVFKKPEKFRTQRGYKLIKAKFVDEKGSEAEVVWFNQQHLLAQLKDGMEVVIMGKPKFEFGKLTFTAPKFEELKSGRELVHAGRIIPIYPEMGKLSSDWFRQKMKIVMQYAKEFEEFLPNKVIEEERLMDRFHAMKEIHFPTSMKKLEEAQRRLALEEVLILQLRGIQKKLRLQKDAEAKGIAIPMDPDFIKEFLETVPFELTDHQKISSFQILKDMEKSYPMSRLLEGDVGSGKTMVSVLVALHTIKKGGVQVALMAPTEVLASQHYRKIAVHLAQFGVNTKYLAGSLTKKQKEDIYEGLQAGTIDFVIGTHALIQKGVSFKKLGLVIIDEQHRFGVGQRKTLSEQGYPHVLHMTATPIPRTLALTIYGDQDISIISEMPAGRKEIKTNIILPHHKDQMYRFVEDQMNKGRQAFVICPLIEESEHLEDVRAATKEHAYLQKHIFPDFRLALLHGKMKAEEKDAIMNDFKEKKYDMLVSTSVIEVGIDIPNASVIIIEGAERFGLSQLHQFRGRVGRGDVQSYCFLATDKSYGGNIQRLKAMEKHSNGFTLAEIDLELRGPGEVYGVRQSGLPDLKMADLSDLELVVRARELAEEILKEDLLLEKWPILKGKVEGEQ